MPPVKQVSIVFSTVLEMPVLAMLIQRSCKAGGANVRRERGRCSQKLSLRFWRRQNMLPCCDLALGKSLNQFLIRGYLDESWLCKAWVYGSPELSQFYLW